MSSLYICDITGTGTRTDPNRPSISTALGYSVLMIDTTKRKAVVYSDDDTIIGSGVTKLVTAASRQALIANAQVTQPSAGQRLALASWLSTNGYPAIPAQALSWWDVVHAVARVVNPAADLNLTGVG